MSDRRQFFKSLLAGGVALGLGAGPDGQAQVPAARTQLREVPKGYAWQWTIFCQLGDPSLLAAIGLQAQRLGCDVYLGEPHSPDIYAIPYFAAVIDRNTLDQADWAGFLEFRAEVDDTHLCILVDSLDSEAGWPIDAHMAIRDPNNPAHVRDLLSLIQQTHALAQRWKPDLSSAE